MALSDRQRQLRGTPHSMAESGGRGDGANRAADVQGQCAGAPSGWDAMFATRGVSTASVDYVLAQDTASLVQTADADEGAACKVTCVRS